MKEHQLFDESVPAEPNLGACCICEGTEGVFVIVLLCAQAPDPGYGWGCVTCGLPNHGAMAVICETCESRTKSQTEAENRLRFFCSFATGGTGRLPIADLRGVHQHRRALHPELEPWPHATIMPTDRDRRLNLLEGQGCTCARCWLTIWAGTGAVRIPKIQPLAHTEYIYHPACWEGSLTQDQAAVLQNMTHGIPPFPQGLLDKWIHMEADDNV
jgi:hypothetical protein